MKTYTFKKKLMIRIFAVVSLTILVIVLTKLSFPRRIFKFITFDSSRYIEEMGTIKARYNKVWGKYRQEYADGDKLLDLLSRSEVTMTRLKEERNMMSKQINEMWKVIGKLQCELTGDLTSQDGGWCQSASMENGGQHLIDHGLVKALSSVLKSKSVGSFGDGPGAYKSEILKLGQVKSFESYDGSPFCEETSFGQVQFLDLTLPQYNIPVYDFVLSLEVAEHIPSQYENTFLDNLFRHARMGIILSWAVPGQGGLSHVNNRPLSYVKDRMKKLGFNLHEVVSRKLQNASTFDWLKKNVFVYVRANFKDVSGKSKTILDLFS